MMPASWNEPEAQVVLGHLIDITKEGCGVCGKKYCRKIPLAKNLQVIIHQHAQGV
jgi:hypothetical protein